MKAVMRGQAAKPSSSIKSCPPLRRPREMAPSKAAGEKQDFNVIQVTSSWLETAKRV